MFEELVIQSHKGPYSVVALSIFHNNVARFTKDLSLEEGGFYVISRKDGNLVLELALLKLEIPRCQASFAWKIYPGRNSLR